MVSQSVFIDPFIDFAFKRLFGTEANKDVLIDLLNTCLPGKNIRDVVFLDKEQVRLAKEYRGVIFDVLCLTDSGEYIIIEVQRLRQDCIKARGLFYAAINIYEQGEKGRSYKYDLKQVHLVSITNFVFDDVNKEQIIHKIKLMDEETGEVFSNLLSSTYIEIPKFKKPVRALRTRLDKWLFTLKNLHRLKKIPVILRGDKIFEKVFEAARIANLTKKEMNAYHRAKLIRSDNRNILLSAIKKGRMQGQLEVAEKMLKDGMSLMLVNKYTGIEMETINALADRIRKN